MQSFVDTRRTDAPSRFDADVCILGGGAAGITLAREFMGTGVRVCVLEAGGMSMDPAVNANSFIEDAGRPYEPNDKRLRYFGGTTNHWGGQCGPMMPIDFEKRDWVAHSGWPYRFEVLEPYYRRSHEVLRLGAYDYDAERIAQELGLDVFPFDASVVETTVTRYQRVRFGLDFGDALDRAENVQVLLYADASDIRLADDTGDAVSHIVAETTNGKAFDVYAKRFIVAAGGIDTPRLLLMANQQRPAGLGNHSDCVGRYFMEHIWFDSGFFAPPEAQLKLPFYLDELPYQNARVRAHITLPERTLREERLTGFRAEIWPTNSTRRTARRMRNGDVGLNDIVPFLSDPVGLGHLAKCRSETPPNAYKLGNYFEQIPNPESRVTLSNDRDSLGRRQPKLEWRLTRQDHDTVVRAHEIIAREVGRSGFGRMKIEVESDPDIVLPGSGGGAHHMGTARMSDDPKFGVVNGDARVHGLQNLYIAGSSIFPTGGWVNPTMTLIATTLKLADHLKQEIARGA